MSAVRGELPHVMDAAAVEALGNKVFGAANLLSDTARDAADRWLRLPEVFDVSDATIAVTMLDGPMTTAADFLEAMTKAQQVLVEFTMTTIPSLTRRREELAARILEVNAQREAAQSALESSDAAYWSAYETDPASETTRRAGEAQTEATDAWRDADSAVGDLEADIRVFRLDLEAAEDFLASDLKAISGGDDPRGAFGAHLTISQTFWGESSSAYPGGPSTSTGLADSLRADLSTAVAHAISWLGTTDADAAKTWMEDHPDFASAVAFVDVNRAAALWNRFANDSVRDDDGAWSDGPLAQIFAVAPSAIGNLNGIPASAKDEFNRAELERMLAGELTEEQRGQLEQVRELLDKGAENPDPPIALLSLSLETDDASPRASIGFGDVDNAGQITTLTHGIATDVAQIGEWSDSAINMQDTTEAELAKRGSSATTAVVLFMDWDSGGPGNVWGIERPDAGAERLAQSLRGYGVTNAGAQLDLGLHSLGTTMGTQMIADNPGLVDNAWLYGSAGVTPETAADLENQIRRGLLTVHATHATDDIIADKGRMPASDHPENPLDIAGVQDFESDGGWVKGYGDGVREWGMRVEGHNSQASKEAIYLLDGFETQQTGGMAPSFIPQWDDEAVGYLDPRSQSFKQTIVDLAESIVAADGVRQ